MGAWGPGNLENDAALDSVEHVLDAATTEIEAFCASDRCTVEDVDAVIACAEIHLALHEHCGASRPDEKVARALQKKVVRLYDEGIDSLEPEANYKRDRRAALVETLARYEQAAHEAQ